MPLHDWSRIPAALFHHFHQDFDLFWPAPRDPLGIHEVIWDEITEEECASEKAVRGHQI